MKAIDTCFRLLWSKHSDFKWMRLQTEVGSSSMEFSESNKWTMKLSVKALWKKEVYVSVQSEFGIDGKQWSETTTNEVYHLLVALPKKSSFLQILEETSVYWATHLAATTAISETQMKFTAKVHHKSEF